MMNKRDLITWVGQRCDKGLSSDYYGWTFTFDFAAGYRADKGNRHYSYFDDLAGMVHKMFHDGCFDA